MVLGSQPARAGETPASDSVAQRAPAMDSPAPDLGLIRYRDPRGPRTIWLGLEVAGMIVPAAWIDRRRAAWSASPIGSWAIGLGDRFAVGGRHEVQWLQSGTVRLRTHLHRLHLSTSLRRRSEDHRDRLAVTVETQRVLSTVVDETDFEVGGLDAVAVGLGYGFAHRLGLGWGLGWRVHSRYAKVLRNDQLQIRVSIRPEYEPAVGHRISVELVGAWNDDLTTSRRLFRPKHGLTGQLALSYGWLCARNVGPWVELRGYSSVRTGEVPLYQIRPEAADLPFGTAILGLRALWK